MAELNQLLISRVLGSRISRVRRYNFGGTAAFPQASAGLLARTTSGPTPQPTPDADVRIADAFEEVREVAPGRRLSPDRVLIDPALNTLFLRRVSERGVDYPPATINRRLLRFRKGSKHVKLTPTTEESEVRGLRRVLVAADFAMVQLAYRRGASVDDMLADPQLGQEFDRLAAQLTPGFDAIHYRTAALFLRKTRNVDKRRRQVLANLHSEQIEAAMENVGAIKGVTATDLPAGPGILTFTEHATQDRSLYIAEGPNLRASFEPFEDLRAFRAVESHFWRPDPSNIELRIFTGKRFLDATTKDWEARLILDRTPIFNLPVRNAA